MLQVYNQGKQKSFLLLLHAFKKIVKPLHYCFFFDNFVSASTLQHKRKPLSGVFAALP
jgi:hypothetical protein